jgi:tRNA 2-selenouridine synthase SelU
MSKSKSRERSHQSDLNITEVLNDLFISFGEIYKPQEQPSKIESNESTNF